MTKVSGIYKITHVSTGRCYVGQTVNIPIRWTHHRGALKAGTHWSRYLQHVYNKYGVDSLRFEVLEECSIDVLTDREHFWFEQLHPVFNTAVPTGSTWGYRHTAATKRKMSDAQRRRFANPAEREAQRQRRLGKPLSDEHRLRIKCAAARRRGDGCVCGEHSVI